MVRLYWVLGSPAGLELKYPPLFTINAMGLVIDSHLKFRILLQILTDILIQIAAFDVHLSAAKCWWRRDNSWWYTRRHGTETAGEGRRTAQDAGNVGQDARTDETAEHYESSCQLLRKSVPKTLRYGVLINKMKKKNCYKLDIFRNSST